MAALRLTCSSWPLIWLNSTTLTTTTTTPATSIVIAPMRSCSEERQARQPAAVHRRRAAVTAARRLTAGSCGAGLVAHPAHGQHDLGALGVPLDLGAQPLHVHVDQ